MARRMISGALILVAIVAAAGLGLRLYMDRAAENRLRPGEEVAIGELRAPLPPNAFLACPTGYCRIAGAAPSPVFAMSASGLYREFAALVAREPRVVTIAAEPQRRRIIVIQRSALFRFPDVVTAEFVALGPDRSSVALYSRPRYGRYDFGVNRRRIERWLARLQRLPPADGGR